MHFSKGGRGGGGGATVTNKKINSQVQWQWAIMDTSLISLADFNASVIKTAMVCSDFHYFLKAIFDWGNTKNASFLESQRCYLLRGM